MRSEYHPFMFRSNLKISPEVLLQVLDGKINPVDRKLLEDFLDEYKFYNNKPTELANISKTTSKNTFLSNTDPSWKFQV